MEPKIFAVGGMWEGNEWEIHFDEDVSYNQKQCPHCNDDKVENGRKIWTCPQVVVMYNEGGCATTGVCLDCILDAEKSLTEARNHEEN